MEALFLSVSSSSIVPRSNNACFLIRKHEVCRRMQSAAALRVRNMVHSSQGGSEANNVVKSSNMSYVVTERSAAVVEQGSKAALMEATAGSLILAPNGKIQTDVGVKDLVPYDGGSSSTALIAEKHDDGIGIVKFLRGKSFLITGGTGFLGKVLIEKILRTVPDVHKIFILIKADNKEVAMERLKNEIMSAELFKFLRQTYGKSYQAFMLSKLVPVVGNVCESGLGMDVHAAESIAMEVDVIINSAANTTSASSSGVFFFVWRASAFRLRHRVPHSSLESSSSSSVRRGKGQRESRSAVRLLLLLGLGREAKKR